MPSFLEELWNSIFTPGTTPTLLIAANVTFATLQVLLVTLLAATHSIHFVILSALCGGLWWSINWFARELKAAQQKEDEAEKLRWRKKGEDDWRSKGEVDDSADDEGEDTEVEDARVGKMGESASSLGRQGGNIGGATPSIRTSEQGPASAGLTSGSQQTATAAGSAIRRRTVEDGDRSGEISTDSEWEKVSAQGEG